MRNGDFKLTNQKTIYYNSKYVKLNLAICDLIYSKAMPKTIVFNYLGVTCMNLFKVSPLEMVQYRIFY
jgi:hypothetical protein